MATLARGRRSRNPLAAEDNVAGWVFLFPALVIFVGFIFGPIFYVAWLSFREWQVITPEKPWVGLENYRAIFDNDDFYIAFRNTLWFSLGVVPTQTAIGLFLAILANRKIRGKTFFRTAFYFPSISSSIVISIIFLWLYQNDGLINFLIRAVGISPPRPPWLQNPNGVIEQFLGLFGVGDISPWIEGPSFALLSIMMLNIWTTAGTMMVIFLAGLQDVPGDVYEAAALDGASRWRQFKDITVPLLRPVTLFVVTLGFIGTFQVFDQIFAMTSGGPAKRTTTLAYLVYQEAFRNFNGGYAAALAMVLFAMILLIYLVQRRIIGPTEQL
jgi:multiple sugar transport system permease protein